MNAHQQLHYAGLALLEKLFDREISEQRFRIAQLIVRHSIQVKREYAFFPRQQHMAFLLKMDEGDVTNGLKWLTDTSHPVIDARKGGLYALNSPEQWCLPLRVERTAERGQLSVQLLQNPTQPELRDPVHHEPLDGAGLLNEELRHAMINDVVASGVRAPGAKVTMMIEAASDAPASGPKAGSIAPNKDGFDVGEFLRLCKNDPASPAALAYLEQFPEAKRRYDEGARGVGSFPTGELGVTQPVGTFPTGKEQNGSFPTEHGPPVGSFPTAELGLSQPVGFFPTGKGEPVGTFPTEGGPRTARARAASELYSSALKVQSCTALYSSELVQKAWEKLQAIDTAREMADPKYPDRPGEWYAMAARSPEKVLGFIRAMESEGWRDKYGRRITSRLSYMAKPAREDGW